MKSLFKIKNSNKATKKKVSTFKHLLTRKTQRSRLTQANLEETCTDQTSTSSLVILKADNKISLKI